MTLGVFHFAYHNLDAVKTVDQDKISVLEEPFQSEIVAISEAICSVRINRLTDPFGLVL
jgi:hypothetical protein